MRQSPEAEQFQSVNGFRLFFVVGIVLFHTRKHFNYPINHLLYPVYLFLGYNYWNIVSHTVSAYLSNTDRIAVLKSANYERFQSDYSNSL